MGHRAGPVVVSARDGRRSSPTPSLARPTTGSDVDDAVRLARTNEVLGKLALNDLLGIELTRMDADGCEAEMPVGDASGNAAGNLHGGAIATLVDVCAATAAAMGSPTFDPMTSTLVTADLHVRYLGRTKGDRIRATASVVRAGTQLVVVECGVTDLSNDRLVATCDMSVMIVPTGRPGYTDLAGDGEPTEKTDGP